MGLGTPTCTSSALGWCTLHREASLAPFWCLGEILEGWRESLASRGFVPGWGKWVTGHESRKHKAVGSEWFGSWKQMWGRVVRGRAGLRTRICTIQVEKVIMADARILPRAPLFPPSPASPGCKGSGLQEPPNPSLDYSPLERSEQSRRMPRVTVPPQSSPSVLAAGSRESPAVCLP